MAAAPRSSRSARRWLGGRAAATALLVAASAHADHDSATGDPPGAAATSAAATQLTTAPLVREIEKAPPPPSHVVYFQYGVAFTTEQVLSPGPICRNTSVPCILGAGGGFAVRAGYRSAGPLYIGGVYELTKQDPNKLYRIALLQQARAEVRYYLTTARVTEPYLSGGLGVSGYGNEWAIDTWGPTGALGAGLEYQITRRTVVGLAINYRLLYFSRFVDTAHSPRAPGVAQLLGLDLVLEQRDAVFRRGEAAPPRAP